MKKILKFAAAVDRMSTFIGSQTSLLIIPMVAALVYEVVARYVFHRPTIWSYDATYMLYGIHYLLGTAITLKLKGHIRIDLFYGRFPAKWRVLVDLIEYVFLFAPVVGVLIYYGYQSALESFLSGERSCSTSWAPALWPLKAIITLSFALLFAQGLAELCRAITFWTGGDQND